VLGANPPARDGRAAVPTRAAFAGSMNVLNEIAGNGNDRRIGYGPFHRWWIRR
jgi:hypothetical protein